MFFSAVKKGRYTHSKKAEAISQSKSYWKTQGQSQSEGHEQVQEVTLPTETDLINPMTSLSPLLSPETGSPGTQSFGMTSTFPGVTSPSSLVAAYSHRDQLTSNSSTVSNMTESSVEDGVSSTDLDLVFYLQSDFSSSSPANVAMDTVSSPRSSRCQQNRRHCSDYDNGITRTIQLLTPLDSSRAHPWTNQVVSTTVSSFRRSGDE